MTSTQTKPDSQIVEKIVNFIPVKIAGAMVCAAVITVKTNYHTPVIPAQFRVGELVTYDRYPFKIVAAKPRYAGQDVWAVRYDLRRVTAKGYYSKKYPQSRNIFEGEILKQNPRMPSPEIMQYLLNPEVGVAPSV